MAIVNNFYKFIYLFEPHTASRSTREALKTLRGSREVGEHHVTYKGMKNRKMLGTRELAYKTISTIRNPYDLFVTMYMVTPERERFSYKEWLREYFKSEREIYRHSDSDYLVRYESLPESLNRVLLKFGTPKVELPYIGKTPGKVDYLSMYDDDDEAAKILEENVPPHLFFGYTIR